MTSNPTADDMAACLNPTLIEFMAHCVDATPAFVQNELASLPVSYTLTLVSRGLLTRDESCFPVRLRPTALFQLVAQAAQTRFSRSGYDIFTDEPLDQTRTRVKAKLDSPRLRLDPDIYWFDLIIDSVETVLLSIGKVVAARRPLLTRSRPLPGLVQVEIYQDVLRLLARPYGLVQDTDLQAPSKRLAVMKIIGVVFDTSMS